MGPEKSLFTMAPGLEAPWHVDDVSCDAARKQIDFEVAFKPGSRHGGPPPADSVDTERAHLRLSGRSAALGRRDGMSGQVRARLIRRSVEQTRVDRTAWKARGKGEQKDDRTMIMRHSDSTRVFV